MKQLYIFSGLGADERAFQNLSFEGYEITFIKWLLPSKSEDIESYAARLCQQITVSDAIFIGLSFGGMAAVEVAKIIQPKQLILIASAQICTQIPFYYRWAGMVGLHKLLPTKVLKGPSFITNWFFSVSEKEEKQLLAAILRDTDEQFLKWAINIIVKWCNKDLPQYCIHIHGTADKILPYRYVKADITIKGGGHFMTVNKSAEINEVLNKLLNERSR